MRYILYNADIETYDERCKLRLAYLVDFKTKLRDELIEYKTVYSCMDDAFIQEIKNAEEQKFWFIRRLFGHKTEIEQPDIIKNIYPNYKPLNIEFFKVVNTHNLHGLLLSITRQNCGVVSSCTILIY